MFLIGFPLLIIPLAIYNMIVFLTPGVQWTDKIAAIRMVSTAEWGVTFGDMLVMLTLFLLLIEVIKSMRVSGRSIVDHLLSFLVFGIAIAELLLVTQAATSTFAIVTAICLVDSLGGLANARGGVRRRRAEPEIPKPTTA